MLKEKQKEKAGTDLGEPRILVQEQQRVNVKLV